MDQDDAPVTEPSVEPAPAPLAGMLRWVAATLLVLGSSAVIVAMFLPREPAVPRRPGWLTAMVVVLAILLVALAVAALRGRADPAHWRGLRRWCVLLVAALAWPAWWSFGDASENLSSGLPVLGPMLFAIGFTAMLCAALLLAVLSPPGAVAGPTVRRRLVGAGAGVLVVAVAVLASLVVVHIGPLDVTTAATVRPAAVPTDPHRQAWAWEAPEGQRVNEVVTAGAGVAVRVVDGVIAIDGTTGKERWHYRRTGSRTSGLGVSPDGRFLLVSFYSSVEDVEGVRVISLDAMTGEEAGFDEVTEGGVFRGIRMEMTNRVLLGGNPDEGLFRGYDLRSGERLWEYRKPQTCRFGDVAGKPMVGRDVVLFGLVCGPKEPRSENVTVTVTLLALDDRTGAERWSIERQVPALAQKGSGPDGDFWTSPGWNIDQFLELASDGSAVSFGWTDSETGAEDRFLADAATGDVLLDATALPTGEIVEFTKEWLVTGKGSVSDAYTITTIVTGSSRAVGEISVRGPSERWFTGELVVGFGQWFSTENACRNMVSIAPWDGAPPRRANIHFGRHDADQYCEYPELELAPGAIVAWHSDTNRIVGIA